MPVSLTGSNGRRLLAFDGGVGGGGVNLTSSLETLSLQQTLLKQQLQELQDRMDLLAQLAMEQKRCVYLVVLCVLVYPWVVSGCAWSIRVCACVRACACLYLRVCWTGVCVNISGATAVYH
jgi:hypothetical protein